jgi:hypothetical protein
MDEIGRINVDARDGPCLLGKRQDLMLHPAQHDFFGVETFMQFIKVRRAGRIPAIPIVMGFAITIDERPVAAKRIIQLSEKIDKSDKIARAIDDRRASQEVAPVTSPSDLQRCLEPCCLAVATHMGFVRPLSDD